MLFKHIGSLILTISLLGFLVSCDDTNQPDSLQTGTLRVSLTDAPGTIEAVYITFIEISAHINNDWVTVSEDTQTVNLMEWNNGESIMIGEADVPAGKYTQIRLKIDSASVVVDGQSHEAEVPSGAQTGLKLVSNFTVVAGSTYDLVIDFDADRSVVSLGPPPNPTGYKLKPTVRAVPRAISGSISGTVTNPENDATAYAIAGDDTVTSAPVDPQSGDFMLAFLPEGSYTVSIRDTLDNSAGFDDVVVTAGADNDLGDITLGIGGQPATGTLTLSLTDATADFDSVNITFAEVSAHLDNRWVSVTLDTMKVNLLDFTNGESVVLGSADVPAGRYSQVRFKILAAEVDIEGDKYSLKVPSGAQSGLKLNAHFTVEEGSTHELMLDFDASRSVVELGPPNNPRGFILKPTLRLISTALTGSISGTVTNPENQPIAYAIAGPDTVTSTPVDESSGFFRLAFLPGGSYTVSVEDTMGLSFNTENVEVTVGSDTDLGSITLE